jgi:hypothetical protein
MTKGATKILKSPRVMKAEGGHRIRNAAGDHQHHRDCEQGRDAAGIISLKLSLLLRNICRWQGALWRGAPDDHRPARRPAPGVRPQRRGTLVAALGRLPPGVSAASTSRYAVPEEAVASRRLQAGGRS